MALLSRGFQYCVNRAGLLDARGIAKKNCNACQTLSERPEYARTLPPVFARSGSKENELSLQAKNQGFALQGDERSDHLWLAEASECAPEDGPPGGAEATAMRSASSMAPLSITALVSA